MMINQLYNNNRYLTMHSSEIKGLCLMKCSIKTLQIFFIIFGTQKPMYVGFFFWFYILCNIIFSVEFENHELIVYKTFQKC